MRVLTPILLAIAATPGLAEGFDRPIPQAQSATAELWYGLASLALVATLLVVHRLVVRR